MSDAALGRSRERWLRQLATETATLAGVLTDLAEHRAVLSVGTASRVLTARLVGVARDFCVLEDRSGAAILVVTAKLTSVTHHRRDRPDRSQPSPPGDPSGDRVPPLQMRFIDALVVLAGERSPVRLTTGAGAPLRGELTAVGTDVVTIRDQGAPDVRTFVPLGVIESCHPQ